MLRVRNTTFLCNFATSVVLTFPFLILSVQSGCFVFTIHVFLNAQKSLSIRLPLCPFTLIIIQQRLCTLTDAVYLYLSQGNSAPLPWSRRLSVAVGTARGVVHLHSGRDRPLIHRDIKSANILLDENFTAKVRQTRPDDADGWWDEPGSFGESNRVWRDGICPNIAR